MAVSAHGEAGMPSLREHIKLSKERTGKGYRELNEWLDGKGSGLVTRIDRHVRMSKHSKYVVEKWGKDGLEEYRSHVNDDVKRFFPCLSEYSWLSKEKDIEKLETRGNLES